MTPKVSILKSEGNVEKTYPSHISAHENTEMQYALHHISKYDPLLNHNIIFNTFPLNIGIIVYIVPSSFNKNNTSPVLAWCV